jgi:rhodanese-related sulfurtransferase
MVENVSPREVFEALRSDQQARLVDVRTDAEWAFVGLPDLSETGQDPVLIPWQVYPTMQVNGAFADHLRQAGLTPENKIYFLCRSGVRSVAAARAAAAAGYAQVFNIADGFEGPPNEDGHRGTISGWKADSLPWQQR